MKDFFRRVHGLAITRIRMDRSGIVIEAEGYGPDLAKWCYRYDHATWLFDWTWYD